MTKVFDFDEIPDCCSACGASLEEGDAQEEEGFVVALQEDVLGNYWCKKHWHRCKVINYGACHGWPEVDCYSFFIPESMTSWYAVMMWCSDDDAFLAEGAIDQLESQEVA